MGRDSDGVKSMDDDLQKVSVKAFWKEFAPILGLEDRKGIYSCTLEMKVGKPVIVRTEEFAILHSGRRYREIIQRDRLATYGPDDMWWAEPLGLAEWGNDAARVSKRYSVVEIT